VDSINSDTHRKVGKGAARLRAVNDPHRKPGDYDPDESGPPCPECGSTETVWFCDRKTAQQVLVCKACPKAGVP
jgi:transcription elongation factor Elf1